MIETFTIIEVLFYILKKLKKADKVKLIKLIYLADKYHLIRYGRTITNDDYYAMEHGPVGTTVKDVLSLDPFNISRNGYKYASALIEKIDENNFRAKLDAQVNFDMLSESDKEALDFVVERFGKMKQWELRDYTHKYPEWYRYEELFKNKLTRRERIDTKELLSTIKNDLLKMPRKHVKESEKILTGKFD
jgi:uncharacterized phage-associated protein